MVGTSLGQDGHWWLELLVDSATKSRSHGSQAERSTLIKAQFSTLDTATERGTSDETEATHQHVIDQWRRLEAADCDGAHVICISVTITFRWEDRDRLT